MIVGGSGEKKPAIELAGVSIGESLALPPIQDMRNSVRAPCGCRREEKIALSKIANGVAAKSSFKRLPKDLLTLAWLMVLLARELGNRGLGRSLSG